MGITEKNIQRIKDQLRTRNKQDTLDERIVSDIARMDTGEQPYYLTRAQYDALIWARDHWLQSCDKHLFHYVNDKCSEE